jgi:hypothetical protein
VRLDGLDIVLRRSMRRNCRNRLGKYRWDVENLGGRARDLARLRKQLWICAAAGDRQVLDYGSSIERGRHGIDSHLERPLDHESRTPRPAAGNPGYRIFFKRMANRAMNTDATASCRDRKTRSESMLRRLSKGTSLGRVPNENR